MASQLTKDKTDRTLMLDGEKERVCERENL